MNKKILTKCKNSNIGQLSYGHYLCQLCNFKKKKIQVWVPLGLIKKSDF